MSPASSVGSLMMGGRAGARGGCSSLGDTHTYTRQLASGQSGVVGQTANDARGRNYAAPFRGGLGGKGHQPQLCPTKLVNSCNLTVTFSKLHLSPKTLPPDITLRGIAIYGASDVEHVTI